VVEEPIREQGADSSGNKRKGRAGVTSNQGSPNATSPVTTAKSSTTEMRDEECNAREGGVDGLELEQEGGQLAVSSAWPLVKSESSFKLTSMPEPPKEQTDTDDQHRGETRLAEATDELPGQKQVATELSRAVGMSHDFSAVKVARVSRVLDSLRVLREEVEQRQEVTLASDGNSARLNPDAVEFVPSAQAARPQRDESESVRETVMGHVDQSGERKRETGGTSRQEPVKTSSLVGKERLSASKTRDGRSNIVEGQMGGRGMEHQGGQITLSGARPLAKGEPSVTFVSTTASPKEQAGTEDQHLGEAVTSAKPRRDDSVERFPASCGRIAVDVTPECTLRHLRVSDPSKELLANVSLDKGKTVGGSALELESTRKEVRLDTEKEARKVGGDVAVEFEEENMDDWRGREAEPEPPPRATNSNIMP
jgi:hypothetical protein